MGKDWAMVWHCDALPDCLLFSSSTTPPAPPLELACFMFHHTDVFIADTGGAALKVFFFRGDTLGSTDAIYELHHPGHEDTFLLSDLPQVRVGHDVLGAGDPAQHEKCPGRQQV